MTDHGLAMCVLLVMAWQALVAWMLYLAVESLVWQVACWLDQQAKLRDGYDDDEACER